MSNAQSMKGREHLPRQRVSESHWKSWYQGVRRAVARRYRESHQNANIPLGLTLEECCHKEIPIDQSSIRLSLFFVAASNGDTDESGRSR